MIFDLQRFNTIIILCDAVTEFSHTVDVPTVPTQEISHTVTSSDIATGTPNIYTNSESGVYVSLSGSRETLNNNADNVYINLLSGDDVLYSTGHNVTIDAGSGDDSVVVHGNYCSINAKLSSNDTVEVYGSHCTISNAEYVFVEGSYNLINNNAIDCTVGGALDIGNTLVTNVSEGTVYCYSSHSSVSLAGSNGHTLYMHGSHSSVNVGSASNGFTLIYNHSDYNLYRISYLSTAGQMYGMGAHDSFSCNSSNFNVNISENDIIMQLDSFSLRIVGGANKYNPSNFYYEK